MGLPTPEHLHRRPRVPLGARVGLGAGHGGRARRRSSASPRCGPPARAATALGSRREPDRTASARLARRRDHARRRGDDPGHRRGADPRRRRVRGDPRLRRPAVRVRGAPGAAGALGGATCGCRSTSRRCAPTPTGCSPHAGAGPDHECLRIMLTRGGRRLLLTEPLPPTPERVAADVDHLLADADPRRRQVALLRGEHARRPARARAGLRRGAAGDAARPRARGPDQLDLLGQGRRAADAAARASTSSRRSRARS